MCRLLGAIGGSVSGHFNWSIVRGSGGSIGFLRCCVVTAIRSSWEPSLLPSFDHLGLSLEQFVLRSYNLLIILGLGNPVPKELRPGVLIVVAEHGRLLTLPLVPLSSCGPGAGAGNVLQLQDPELELCVRLVDVEAGALGHQDTHHHQQAPSSHILTWDIHLHYAYNGQYIQKKYTYCWDTVQVF